MRLTPFEVAELLGKIYEEEFGGKLKGRYIISRTGLRELSGRKGRLEDAIIAEIIFEAFEQGYVVTDLGEEFSVVQSDVMRGFRKVPSRLIEQYQPAD